MEAMPTERHQNSGVDKQRRPLNVLWLIDHVCYDGSLHGGGRLYMNLMPRFDANEVRVHPYFLRASDEVRELFEAAEHPVINLDKSKYDVSAILTVSKLCKTLEIDVLHLFCYAASTFGRIVGAALNIPTVIHDFDTQIYFPYPMYLKVMDRVLANFTASGFAASSVCRDYMRDVRAVPAERLEVLYHTIPDDVLHAAANANAAAVREQLGWPQDQFIFGCITKLGPERGNDTLLEAFKRVVNEDPTARLALIYKPTLYHRVPEEYEDIPWIRDLDEMRKQITESVKTLGIEEHVYLIEIGGSTLPYYAACDTFVAPFENVRFSSVNLVEGLAFGKPFIATDIGELLEIHDRYGVGTLVKPGDAGALAESMISAVSEPEKVREDGVIAARMAKEFTVEAITRRFVQHYRALVDASQVQGIACDPR